MKTWIYSWIVYPLGFSLATLIGIFNRKVRDTLRLRAWKDFLSLRFNAGQPIEYWVHVASAGELEYAIPILEEIGRRQKKALVTYYSISAQRPVESLPQKYSCVSLVVPLPHDGLGLMREFVRLARAQGVRSLLILKYELWPGLLWECKAHDIKVLLVDALKPSWFHRRLLHKIDAILSGYSSEIEEINHRNAQVVGDTRVERVLQRFENIEGKLGNVLQPALRDALSRLPVLVCGSMWPADTKLIQAALGEYKRHGRHCNVIWVPHELDADNARKAQQAFAALGFMVREINDATKSSDPVNGSVSGPLALIVMRKGILVELYRLGQAAYVGGGFGSGVHSVWEPALAGLTVACGPRTERSPESLELAAQQMLTRVQTEQQAASWLEKNLAPSSADLRVKSEQRLTGVVSRHAGAARRIIEVCEGIR